MPTKREALNDGNGAQMHKKETRIAVRPENNYWGKVDDFSRPLCQWSILFKQGGEHQAVTRPENLDEFSQYTISFKIGESTHGLKEERGAQDNTRAVVTVLKDLVSSQRQPCTLCTLRQPCTSPISLSLSAQWRHKYANWSKKHTHGSSQPQWPQACLKEWCIIFTNSQLWP